MEYRASKKDRWSWNGIKENVDIDEVSGYDEIEISDVLIKTTDVIHTIDTQAYRFEVDGKSIVVTRELKYSENLIELAKDADLMDIGF